MKTLNEHPVLVYLLLLVVACLITMWIIANPAIGNQLLSNMGISKTTPAPSLGDELIFPDGWTPVECDSNHVDYAHARCTWVCVKDSVYRYCTPTIQTVTVEADQTQDGTR